MRHELILTPHGRLLTRAVEAEDACLLEGVPGEELHQAFAASSAEGLLRLMAMPPAVRLPPPFAYWRDFARRQLDSLCHLPETAPAVRPEIPAPTPADLAEWLLS
ncbi:MAG: hypothetical protein RBS99_17125, partial [Rhodospirillales bacterium]|nr:hypothetical protein [Rhodospirillales bacterium]